MKQANLKEKKIFTIAFRDAMSSVKVSQTLGLERLMDNMDHIYIRIYQHIFTYEYI